MSCRVNLITGASGFVGRALSDYLLSKGECVRGTLLPSESVSVLPAGVEPFVIGPIDRDTSWTSALAGVKTVVHLAARVHVMHETAVDALFEFRKTNTAGTLNLALQAAQTGVKRFVFISTIGVNGDNSGNRPYSEDDIPSPHNAYSVSKYEAELGLRKISREFGIEVVVIRAPLVYGPGNPGNFLSLLRIIAKGLPLPLASINNKRSFIYIGNLVDLLGTCVNHPAASGQLFLVSDGDDVSTPELIRLIAVSLGVTVMLLPFPVSLLRLAAKLTGNSRSFNQLSGSLTVDSYKVCSTLHWKPPFSMGEGLHETAEWFKRQFQSV